MIYGLSEAQSAMVARLFSGGEESPPADLGRDTARARASWLRTAHSLKRRRVVEFSDRGFCEHSVRLTEFGRLLYTGRATLRVRPRSDR